MRVLVNNSHGRCEVLLIDKARIHLSNTELCLHMVNNRGVIYVNVGTNANAHMLMSNLLKDGYVDLSEFATDYKKFA